MQLARFLLIGALLMTASATGQEGENVRAARTIKFGGFEWWVKESDSRKVGPGPNLFSGQNVALDAGGRVRLKAGSRGEACVSAEIVTSTSLGYGTYRFTVDSNLDKLPNNLVLGLFTWDDTSSESFHREMDVEIGRWGQEGNADAQFVIQPSTIPRNIERFRLPRGLVKSAHSFAWGPDRASFLSEGVDSGGARIKVQEHVFEHMIPEPGNEKVRINLWCTDGKAPMAGQSEVILGNFEFEPLR